MYTIKIFFLLFGIGTLTGFINVMAGGGSSLTLPVLIFLGLESAVANGTNRVAIFLQNLSALLSFRQEHMKEFKTSMKLAAFALPGAITGAIIAVRIDNYLFQKILGFVILGVMLTIIVPRKNNWHSNNQQSPMHAWLIYPAIFVIGFYGGFMQVGTGFLMMAALSYILHMDLVRVNLHKVTIIGIYTVPALLIFIVSGDVNWFFGLSLAAGNAFGAWWSAKISIKKGEKVIRFVLVIAMIIMSLKLLQIF